MTKLIRSIGLMVLSIVLAGPVSYVMAVPAADNDNANNQDNGNAYGHDKQDQKAAPEISAAGASSLVAMLIGGTALLMQARRQRRA